MAVKGDFVVPQEVYDNYTQDSCRSVVTAEDKWNKLICMNIVRSIPEMKEKWDNYHNTDNAI